MLNNLMWKLKTKKKSIQDDKARGLDALSDIIDISSELHILQQAQKIINKYDMDTKKEKHIKIDDNTVMCPNCFIVHEKL